eukprot:7059904-Karenia_brevis.AAC.1
MVLQTRKGVQAAICEQGDRWHAVHGVQQTRSAATSPGPDSLVSIGMDRPSFGDGGARDNTRKCERFLGF